MQRGSEGFDVVKPGDELVEVNGAMVVDPKDEGAIADLAAAIENAPRPLVATFVEGEDREQLFAAQEAKRGPAKARTTTGGATTGGAGGTKPLCKKDSTKNSLLPL